MMKNKISLLKVISFIVLGLFSLIMFSMLLWALITSLKTPDEFYDNVISLPKTWAFKNYWEVLSKFVAYTEGTNAVQRPVYIEEMLWNTILYAGVGSFIATFIPMITAYATAKFDFGFSKVIYFIVIVTTVLPIVGSLPSMLDMLLSLGLYDKMYGTWIQKMNFTSIYYLVFYSTFKSMSREYSEAAYVDGASEFRVMVSISFPLVKNVFSTILLILFISFWNDYQSPMLFVPSYPTLAYGVYYVCIRDNRGIFTYSPGHMTVCIIVALPIVILFMIFKEKLIGNLTMGGIKG